MRLLNFLGLVLCVFAVACTLKAPTSNGSNPLGPTDDGTGGGGGNNLIRKLWSRGPLQALNNFTLDAEDSTAISNAPRVDVTLYDLSSPTGGLFGSTLKVYDRQSVSNGATRTSTSLALRNSATEIVPWAHKDFKQLMLYAHGSQAFRYMRRLYPNLAFTVGNRSMVPLEAYATEPGDPLNTGYAPSSTGKPGTVIFYQYPDSAGKAPYNPVDEAEAVYHEFGHALQHLLNPAVLQSHGNYDVDLLLEGLADFFAASMLRDDQILLYLGRNAPLFLSANARNGRAHTRKLGLNLSYPQSYVGEIHLDGRIVANTLNDVRKYLEGSAVTLLQCSDNCNVQCSGNCTVQWNQKTTALTSAAAFDKANFMAHQALKQIVPLSTLVHYAETFLVALNAQSWSENCTSASCKQELVDEVTQILKGRGILPQVTIRSESAPQFTFSGTDSALDVNATVSEIDFTNQNMFFLPLFSSSGESNRDLVVDRCEAVLAIPNVRLRSGLQASSYDTLIKLTSATNFSVITMNNKNIDNLSPDPEYASDKLFFDRKQRGLKTWGFLLGSDFLTTEEDIFFSRQKDIFGLVGNTDSRFYQDFPTVGGSHLSPLPYNINPNNPSPLGWAFRAPATVGTVAKINFNFSTRPYEIRYATPTSYFSQILVQQLTVSSSANEFCP